MSNKHECLFVLSYINANRESILRSYNFKEKQMRENYIINYKNGASMGMQPTAWIIVVIFSHWISHFIQALGSRGGISPTNFHLLIIDGHNFRVTLEVV